MSDTATNAGLQRTVHYYQLKEKIEEFLYAEADILDQRKFREWLELLAEDIVYSMPLRRNVRFGEHAAHEDTRAGKDICWFDEDKWTLSKRVEQLMTGIHWAEEPLSRTTRFVSNVQHRCAAFRGGAGRGPGEEPFLDREASRRLRGGAFRRHTDRLAAEGGRKMGNSQA